MKSNLFLTSAAGKPSNRSAERTRTIVHNLNNPLAVILGYAELITSLPQVDPAVRANANQIVTAASRMRNSIREILSAESATSAASHRAKVSFAEFWNSNMPSLAELCRTAGVTFEHGNNYDKSISMEAEKILQALENLVANGIRAVCQMWPNQTEKRKINLHSRASQGLLIMTVTDNGIGMPADKARRMMMGSPRGDDIHGHGIGLRFVRLTIEAHGGRFQVQSKPGQGTTFTLMLPLVA